MYKLYICAYASIISCLFFPFKLTIGLGSKYGWQIISAPLQESSGLTSNWVLGMIEKTNIYCFRNV